MDHAEGPLLDQLHVHPLVGQEADELTLDEALPRHHRPDAASLPNPAVLPVADSDRIRVCRRIVHVLVDDERAADHQVGLIVEEVVRQLERILRRRQTLPYVADGRHLQRRQILERGVVEHPDQTLISGRTPRTLPAIGRFDVMDDATQTIGRDVAGCTHSASSGEDNTSAGAILGGIGDTDLLDEAGGAEIGESPVSPPTDTLAGHPTQNRLQRCDTRILEHLDRHLDELGVDHLSAEFDLPEVRIIVVRDNARRFPRW